MRACPSCRPGLEAHHGRDRGRRRQEVHGRQGRAQRHPAPHQVRQGARRTLPPEGGRVRRPRLPLARRRHQGGRQGLGAARPALHVGPASSRHACDSTRGSRARHQHQDAHGRRRRCASSSLAPLPPTSTVAETPAHGPRVVVLGRADSSTLTDCQGDLPPALDGRPRLRLGASARRRHVGQRDEGLPRGCRWVRRGLPRAQVRRSCPSSIAVAASSASCRNFRRLGLCPPRSRAGTRLSTFFVSDSTSSP